MGWCDLFLETRLRLLHGTYYIGYILMKSKQPVKKLVFHSIIQVFRHGVLKNSKRILKNRRTGRTFLGSSVDALAQKRHLTNSLLQQNRTGLAFESKYRQIEPTSLAIEFLFAYPYKEIITKKGLLNRRSGDLSNLYQLPEDCLQAAGLILDDALIVSHAGSAKVLSPDENYYLSIKIFELPGHQLKTLALFKED